MSEGAEQSFEVSQAGFRGTLAELAGALRTQRLLPSQVDLPALVRDYLAYFEASCERDLELASEALPRVAQVIEIKLRLLLPRPPRSLDEAEEEAELELALEALEGLERLEEAIDFLRQRRDERRMVLPARAPRPEYPRRERPLAIAVDRLAQLAARHRPAGYFELAIERFTIAGAMKRLAEALGRRRRALLSELCDGPEWEVRAVMFAGLLELVREGRVRARQERPYAEIELEAATEAVVAAQAAAPAEAA